MPEEDRQTGTVIRGADGALYFIPDEAMKAFRLKGERGLWARNLIEAVDEASGVSKTNYPDLYDWTNQSLKLAAALRGVSRAALGSTSPTKVG